jgi:hypothetical protein
MKARALFEILQTQVKAPNKYFTEEEIKETLRGVYKKDQKSRTLTTVEQLTRGPGSEGSATATAR